MTTNNVGLFNQALGLHRERSFAQAKAIYEFILQSDHRHAGALHMLGAIAMHDGNYDLAANLIGDAVNSKPDYVNAYCDRGTALQNLSRFEEAIASYDAAIRLKPDFAIAHANKGNALQQLRRFEDAIASYDIAIQLNPNNAGVHFNRSMALRLLNRNDEAIVSLQRTIQLNPKNFEAHSILAAELLKLQRFDSAIESYDKALQLQPMHSDLHCNRGAALFSVGRLQEAIDSCSQAISIDPEYAAAYYNRGSAHQELGQFDQAISDYDQAIRIEPSYVSAYWNKSLTLLLTGNYKDGWPLHEWRWKSEQFRRAKKPGDFAQPMWLGNESLWGKTILLHGEQGLGDTIQFCRYVKLVKAQGATVLLQAAKPLIPLLQTLEAVDLLIEKGQPHPPFDFHCPLLSLPLAFNTELHSIPRPNAYLRADSRKVQEWSDKLGTKTLPRIGLAWRGNPKHRSDQLRSMALHTLLPLPSNFEYFSLQKDVRDDEKELLRTSPIRDFRESMHDFSDTAALCDLMDLVISVDTSVAHLSAAIGKPTWILVQDPPDWRWLLEREDSPWYASVKLFRQGPERDWAHVWKRVWADAFDTFHALP